MYRNKELLKRARAVLPGGVNSPVRAFGSVGGEAPFISHGKGSHLWDMEGNEYLDYVCSWGALVLGHAREEVVQAVKVAAEGGTSFGANVEAEVEIAELITSMVPSIEMVRMVNSGTEAAMGALRLARGFTKREKIIKFDGCYHGHADSFLIRAGSGVLTLGIPGSPGVTEGTARDTRIAQFNDLDSVMEIIEGEGDQIAAVILEPVMGNAGVIPPEPGFLQALREITRERGIVLIFDEVITGFRVASGGAQQLYGVTPDLTCLGKIIGGGFPVGAFGGRADIMRQLAPEGPVYQAGTLSGNPVALAAGLATLRILLREDIHGRLEVLATRLEKGIRHIVDRLGLSYSINRVGSMLSLFFADGPIKRFSDVQSSDTEAFSRYFSQMSARGIYLAPSAFEASFVSSAHSEVEIDKTVEASYQSLKSIVSGCDRGDMAVP